MSSEIVTFFKYVYYVEENSDRKVPESNQISRLFLMSKKVLDISFKLAYFSDVIMIRLVT
jgi:hypothetical protein